MSENTNKYPWQSKYSLAEDSPIHGNFEGFGIINLKDVSLEGDDNLFAAGFTGLLKIKEKPQAKDATK